MSNKEIRVKFGVTQCQDVPFLNVAVGVVEMQVGGKDFVVHTVGFVIGKGDLEKGMVLRPMAWPVSVSRIMGPPESPREKTFHCSWAPVYTAVRSVGRSLGQVGRAHLFHFLSFHGDQRHPAALHRNLRSGV